MPRLLYVEASPRKDRSASIEVSRAFLEAYRVAHPDDQVETLDIWASDLPSFNGEALAAKYAGLSGMPLTTKQKIVWDEIQRLAAPFLTADKLLLAVPLWNFGIPYRLTFCSHSTTLVFEVFSKLERPPSSTRVALTTCPPHLRRRLQLMIFRGLTWKCGSALSASPRSAKSSLRRRSSVQRSMLKVERRRSGGQWRLLDNFSPSRLRGLAAVLKTQR